MRAYLKESKNIKSILSNVLTKFSPDFTKTKKSKHTLKIKRNQSKNDNKNERIKTRTQDKKESIKANLKFSKEFPKDTLVKQPN